MDCDTIEFTGSVVVEVCQMLLILFGPSCSGKKTIANIISGSVGAKIWKGKEYVRLGKTEREAWKNFEKYLSVAAEAPQLTEKSIIFITEDPGQLVLELTPTSYVRVIHITAGLEILKQRFSRRLRAPLPAPVERMLLRQIHGSGIIAGDTVFDTSITSADRIAEQILHLAAE
jgi:hypothetical protein